MDGGRSSSGVSVAARSRVPGTRVSSLPNLWFDGTEERAMLAAGLAEKL